MEPASPTSLRSRIRGRLLNYQVTPTAASATVRQGQQLTSYPYLHYIKMIVIMGLRFSLDSILDGCTNTGHEVKIKIIISLEKTFKLINGNIAGFSVSPVSLTCCVIAMKEPTVAQLRSLTLFCHSR